MSNKITKKGRNPGAVDSWLDTLGLYRKNVAYDETCLFRAVSEQLLDCQVYHERIRKECIDYARANYHEFTMLVDNKEQWMEHLQMLEKHMVVCGNMEIQIISRKYRREIIIYDAARQQVFDVTKTGMPNSLLLCLMDEDHYDVVYKRDHIVNAGFCQSIVYKLLYEKVFHIPNVDDIVNAMLYDKVPVLNPKEMGDQKNDEQNYVSSDNLDETEDNNLLSPNVSTNIAPFPFKVAKALDPTIYRNIEYDSWGEVRREMRLGDWYYGDDKLILGTRCVLTDDERQETHDCYIQEIIKDKNKCVVYLTKLAERRTVNYTDLSPENDAKPWPLPYRFSKNLVIGSTQAPVIEKVAKSVKKRNKDKRRTKSCSESSAISNNAAASDGMENVNAYVGIPLQMQNQSENYRQQENSQVEVNEVEAVPEVLATPEVQSTPNRYQWEQTPWHQYLPPTPDPFVWPQTPTTPHSMFNYNIRPMVASAPVTPDVVPYHDPSYPFFYNYHVEPYNACNHWTPHTEYQQVQVAPQNHHQENEKSSEERSQKSPPDTPNQHSYETIQTNERPTLCTSIPTPNPPMEVYSPMIPIHPGTPVIYTTAPEMTEMMMPTTPITMYPSPVDMQYVTPSPYVYPPTPPAAWYPAGINSQGFIFPPINTQGIPK